MKRISFARVSELSGSRSSRFNQVNNSFINFYLDGFKQATGMTKISRGGGIFENFSARGGGILPEVSKFDRKSRF